MINALRAKQQRNLLSTLLLSQGVPMLLAGDECNRTQRGNNNAYCQGNELSWLDWRLDDDVRDLLAFTRALIQIRKGYPARHWRSFFQGPSIHGPEVRDIEWFRSDEQEVTDDEWSYCLGKLLNGQAMDEWGERGEHVRDDMLLVLLNAYWEPIFFMLPPHQMTSRGSCCSIRPRRMMLRSRQCSLAQPMIPISDE